MEKGLDWNAFRSSVRGKGYSQSQIRSMYKAQANEVVSKPATRKPSIRKPATRKPATRKPATRKPVIPKPATPKITTPKPVNIASSLSMIDNIWLPDEMLKIILSEADYNTAIKMCQANTRMAELCRNNQDILNIKKVIEFKNKHNIAIKCEDEYSKSPGLLKSYYKAVMMTDHMIENKGNYKTYPIKGKDINEAFPLFTKINEKNNISLTFSVVTIGVKGGKSEPEITIALPTGPGFVKQYISIVDIVCGLAYLYNKKILKFIKK